MKKCRIIGGKLKRRYIIAPDTSSTRPTSDIVKQSVFNVLVHRFCVNFEKTFVIDLFAGSGSLGIEAVSFGCKNVVFIDSNKKAIDCIKQNIQSLQIAPFSATICQSAEKVPDSIFLTFGENHSDILVFLDPPYAKKELLCQQIGRFFELFKSKNLLIVAESDEEYADATYVIRHGNTRVNILCTYENSACKTISAGS